MAPRAAKPSARCPAERGGGRLSLLQESLVCVEPAPCVLINSGISNLSVYFLN